MSDIVTRLRRWTHAVDAAPASDLMDEAANEIERLRLTDALRSLLARLRMIATLRFDLSDPGDERLHRYALAGRDALIALQEIDRWARGRLKHGTPSAEATHDLEAVRAMIPHELVNLLH